MGLGLILCPAPASHPTQFISHADRLRPLKIHSGQALAMVNAPRAVVVRHADQVCQRDIVLARLVQMDG